VSTFLGVEDEDAMSGEGLISCSKKDPDASVLQAGGSFVMSSDETV